MGTIKIKYEVFFAMSKKTKQPQNIQAVHSPAAQNPYPAQAPV